MAEKIIEFDKVVAGYSPSLTILNETTLDARAGEITLLIGPNGAGKSTVLKTLFGILVPRSGEVRFEGKRINGKTPRQLLAEGMAFVPQGRNLFGSLSVRHNLELGGVCTAWHRGPYLIDGCIHWLTGGPPVSKPHTAELRVIDRNVCRLGKGKMSHSRELSAMLASA